MSKKATSVVSYLTIIGWVIAYCAGDREGAKFYLNQSLLLVLVSAILSVVLKVFSGGIIGTVAGILNFVVFIFWIIGFIHAIKQEEIPLPIIGEITLIK